VREAKAKVTVLKKVLAMNQVAGWVNQFEGGNLLEVEYGTTYDVLDQGMKKERHHGHIASPNWFAYKPSLNSQATLSRSLFHTMIERFHGTVKERTKIVRGFRNSDTAELFAKGYQTYYNFVRPHKDLNGLTPAEAAGMPKIKLKRWLAII
jgi:hypothetical protein